MQLKHSSSTSIILKHIYMYIYIDVSKQKAWIYMRHIDTSNI